MLQNNQTTRNYSKHNFSEENKQFTANDQTNFPPLNSKRNIVPNVLQVNKKKGKKLT